MHELEHEINNIERIIVDPEFANMIDTVHTINGLLESETPSDERATEIVDRVNQLWRDKGFHNEAMYVSGMMSAGETHKKVSYTPLSDATHFHKHRVVSQGFFIHTDVSEAMMSESGTPLVRKVMMMKGRTLIDDPAGVGGKTNVECAINLLEAQLNYREQTPARAAAWLSEYYEEIKQEIDTVLYEADECIGAVTLLKDVTIDVSSMTKAEKKKLYKRLHLWLNKEVVFDRHFPYIVSTDGVYTRFNPQDIRREEYSGQDIIYARDCTLQVGEDTKTHLAFFALSAEIVEGPQQVSMPASIPLGSIIDIESTRP